MQSMHLVEVDLPGEINSGVVGLWNSLPRYLSTSISLICQTERAKYVAVYSSGFRSKG